MACGEGPKSGSLLLTLVLTFLLLLSTANLARGEPAELEHPDDKATLVDCEKQERYASANLDRSWRSERRVLQIGRSAF